MEEFKRMCGEDGVLFSSIVIKVYATVRHEKDEEDGTVVSVGFTLDIATDYNAHLRVLIAHAIMGELSTPTWATLERGLPVLYMDDEDIVFRFRSPHRHRLKVLELARALAAEIQNVTLIPFRAPILR